MNILEHINYERIINNKDLKISHISDFLIEAPNTISWCSDKYVHKLSDVVDKTIIISTTVNIDLLPINNNYIIVNNPRKVFKEVLDIMHPVNKKSFIGDNVVIEDNVKIGDNVRIGHNTVILKNTTIHDDVIIGCNCTIGGYGYGYEKNDNGQYEMIQHIGGVIISSNVHIGNNTTIDKGVLTDTFIGSNTKIDNLVHIAHNVKIGNNCMIIANTMIGGSVEIGDDVWISPSTSIINGIKIGSNSMTGMGSVIINGIGNNELHVGVPAKKIKDI